MADGRNEPSMDEILASIKRIIADDDRNRPTAKRAAKPAAPDAAEDEVLELTDTDYNAGDGEVLLDDDKAQGLRHSFSALQTLAEPGAAPQIVRSGETSLEAMTRDLLRPMLKDWLDTHLPAIVEAMVEREITRITKKR
jgi:cell pole-organizing protein PopZ